MLEYDVTQHRMTVLFTKYNVWAISWDIGCYFTDGCPVIAGKVEKVSHFFITFFFGS